MTEGDKKILLKDLCGRLPYGVYIYHPFYDNDNPQRLDTIFAGVFCGEQLYLNSAIQCCGDDFDEPFHDILECKPYLRPMCDMTDEEIKELYKIEPSAIVYGAPEIETIRIVDDINQLGIEMDKMNNVIDYLNSIHIDHRGLIKKGLALPAPEGMYDKSNNI